MKSLIIFFAFCITLSTAEAQLDSAITNHKFDAGSLMKKSRNQKTTAWILLAGGAVMSFIGESIQAKEASDQFSADLATIFTLGYIPPKEVDHSTAGPILSIAGVAAMLGSIPMFISAHKNKKEAALIMRNESAFFNPKINIGRFPSVGLKIIL